MHQRTRWIRHQMALAGLAGGLMILPGAALAEDDSIEAPGRSGWDTTADPDVVIARDNLARAERRAAAAEKAYGVMRRDNYPRGEARIQIVNERDEARQGLEAAKRALAAVED